mgnify:CR=1 FL=1
MFGWILGMSDWGLGKYKLILQILSVFLIVLMLVYMRLSNRNKDD